MVAQVLFRSSRVVMTSEFASRQLAEMKRYGSANIASVLSGSRPSAVARKTHEASQIRLITNLRGLSCCSYPLVGALLPGTPTSG